MTARIDLFTTTHKGLRALLFDLATDAARIDPSAAMAVALLVERIHRAIAYLDEHALYEEAHIMPRVRLVAPGLAEQLDTDRLVIEAAQTEVEACADELAHAPLELRRPLVGQLVRLMNLLIVQYLAHMGRKETTANEALWTVHSDTELAGIRERMVKSIPPERYMQWMLLIVPALDPAERRAVPPVQSLL